MGDEPAERKKAQGDFADASVLLHRFCYIVHFFLLGLDLAVIANLIGFVRIGISLYSRSWFWVFAVWGVSIAAAGLSQPTSFIAVLPIMASMILTLTLFRLTGAAFRIGLIVGSVLWVVHNIWAGSYGGVVLETGMIISVLFGWYRAEKEMREKQSAWHRSLLQAKISGALRDFHK